MLNFFNRVNMVFTTKMSNYRFIYSNISLIEEFLSITINDFMLSSEYSQHTKPRTKNDTRIMDLICSLNVK